ncbi:MAG TPA: hypothetical protein V6D25_01835 [Leptolyngbyaceae cyanobacterium]
MGIVLFNQVAIEIDFIAVEAEVRTSYNFKTFNFKGFHPCQESPITCPLLYSLAIATE